MSGGEQPVKPQWVLDLEAKHGLPIERIPGHVYVLHYDTPTIVRSVSGDYPHVPAERGGFESTPITHYVGWTQQADPKRRVRRHGPGAADALVALTPGTMLDEVTTKRSGRCPSCDKPLAPGTPS